MVKKNIYDVILTECPDLDNECISQMDYYLVGRESYDEAMRNIRREPTPFDDEYIRIGKELIDNGLWTLNTRTGKRCLTVLGGMMKFDLSNGEFPLLTTKEVYYKPLIAELIGFIRGYDNAKDFRDLGCNIWNANANETAEWLNNENRKGVDDLGRIYGVQARGWRTLDGSNVDQLKTVIEKISMGIDDRRLIVSHWNAGELDQMALPPCHLLYQFSILDNKLHLTMYQRSADYPLGVPFNIASYALLLILVARITNMEVGTFTHFLNNIHIYEDQVELFKRQLTRIPYKAPKIHINNDIKSLADLETWVTVDDFEIQGYTHHPSMKYPFTA